MRTISYPQALNEAFAHCLTEDKSAFIVGQGADDPLAMFGVTKNLPELFGAERIFESPLSEEAVTGICTGAAMNGMRPMTRPSGSKPSLKKALICVFINPKPRNCPNGSGSDAIRLVCEWTTTLWGC